MIFFNETKFNFTGDEYLYAEISREMKIESTLKALSITEELRRRDIPGITEIYPNNTSYLIRYDPHIIAPHHLLDYLKDVDQMKNKEESLTIDSQIIEIPVLYDDALTQEVSLRYAEHHGKSTATDFDYVVEIGGFANKANFIEKHTHPLYLMTAVGFKPGTAWGFPLTGEENNIIEVPKYRSPRPYTPGQAVGIGGVFSVVYPSDSSGSYQLIGMSAVPVYDVHQKLPPFQNRFALAKPGDLWRYKAIDVETYDRIQAEVKAGTYEYKIRPVSFSAAAYNKDGAAYIAQLKAAFDHD